MVVIGKPMMRAIPLFLANNLPIQQNRRIASIVRKTDYIQCVDTDDIALPNRFSRQLDFLNRNKEIDVVGTYIEEFGDGIKYTKTVKYPLEHKNMLNF